MLPDVLSAFLVVPIGLLEFIDNFIPFASNPTVQLILYNELTYVSVLIVLVTAFVVDGIDILARSRAFTKSQSVLSKFRADLAASPHSRDPDVTIVLPAYKNPQEVERCIHYLLKAGIPRKKILVVDDYSNDQFQTAKSAASLGVQVISIGRNGQKVGAVNVGLDAADTKYVIVLDSDSVLLASYDRLAKAIEEMEILGLDVMACRVLPCPPASEVGTALNMDKKSLLLELQYLEYDQAMRLGRGSMYAVQKMNGSYGLKYADVLTVPGAFGIFRRTLLRQVMSNIKEESILAEDAERTLKILGKNGKVGYADDIVVFTAAKLDVASHFNQRVAWAAGFFRCFVSRFGVSVCRRKLAGATYLSMLVRDILIHPLKILSIPFLLLYPLEFLSLMGFYIALNVVVIHKVNVDVKLSRATFALVLFYRLYMTMFPTSVGYFKAFVHEIRLHLCKKCKVLPIEIVRVWNTPLQGKVGDAGDLGVLSFCLSVPSRGQAGAREYDAPSVPCLGGRAE